MSFKEIVNIERMGNSQVIDKLLEVRKDRKNAETMLTEYLREFGEMDKNNVSYKAMLNVRLVIIRFFGLNKISDDKIKQIGRSRLMAMYAGAKLTKQSETGWMLTDYYHEWTADEIDAKFFTDNGRGTDPVAIKKVKADKAAAAAVKKEEEETKIQRDVAIAIENQTVVWAYRIFPVSLLKAGISQKKACEALENFASEYPLLREKIENEGGYTACIKLAVKEIEKTAAKKSA